MTSKNPRVPNVPSDWSTVPIGEVADKIPGKKPNVVSDEPQAGLKKYVTAEAYEGSITSYADPETGNLCNSSDVVLVWDGSVGKVLSGVEGVLGSTMAALRFDEEMMDPRFAYFYLYEKQELISSLAEGTTILHLPRDFLEIFEIPRPPLSEQREIVRLLTDLEGVRNSTGTIRSETEELKRGTINRLLENGVKDHDQKQVRIGPRMEKIPEEWDLRTVDEIAISGKAGLRGGPPGGKIKKEVRTTTGYKIYVQENIIERNFEKRSDYLPEEKYQDLKSAAAKPGDILITTEGSIGRAAVLPEKAEEGIVNNHLARLRVDTDQYHPEYIAEVIDSSDLVRSQIESLSNNSGRPGLNLKILKEFQIPVPNIEEQTDIIEVLGAYDSKVRSESKFLDAVSKLEEGVRGKIVTGEVRFK
ncbi:restriction endonuclease subunit S [Halobacterium bonnevillei]|uniref:Type I restriction modification DNA specificity domain-containing protein n=1 Tax=Halobacterium bonnevillei TaxID=2692200 RepID=A0A6B0SC53_9EURY|nr:restriction endonuclease subunit S [Halobacterium bonnevillei]MXR19234.1 hypothetical protein [Halobacterium bonnevillei]